MTLTQVIISDSYRESMLTPLGGQPDAAQTAEGLRLLQRVVSSVFGNEVGENLVTWPIGSNYIYSGWTPEQWCYLQSDISIVVADGQDHRLKLPPFPQDGDRLQLIDSGSGFAAHPVTLVRQAALFEGSTDDYVADTDGFNQIWIYRADLADWKRVTPLVEEDQFPFPEKHDDAFIGLLAMRLNPRYQQTLSQESRVALDRARGQLQSAYRRVKVTPADLAVQRLTGSWPYNYGGLGGGPGTLEPYLNGYPYGY